MEPEKPQIVLAEDEPDLLESLQMAFRMEGYPVAAFSDGASARDHLASLPETSNHVLVTDVRLPGIDGIELIRFAKERFPHLAAVAVTGYGDKPMLTSLLRTGCDDFLDKPFEPEELIAVVERTVALQKKRIEEAIIQLKAVPSMREFFQPMVEEFGAAGNKPEGAGAAVVSGQGGIKVQHLSSMAKIDLSADLVGKTSEQLLDSVESLLTVGVRHMEIDMSGVGDMDALSLSVLCSLSNELRGSRGTLSLYHVQPPVRKLLEHVRLDRELFLVS